MDFMASSLESEKFEWDLDSDLCFTVNATSAQGLVLYDELVPICPDQTSSRFQFDSVTRSVLLVVASGKSPSLIGS